MLLVGDMFWDKLLYKFILEGGPCLTMHNRLIWFLDALLLYISDASKQVSRQCNRLASGVDENFTNILDPDQPIVCRIWVLILIEFLRIVPSKLLKQCVKVLVTWFNDDLSWWAHWLRLLLFNLQ